MLLFLLLVRMVVNHISLVILSGSQVPSQSLSEYWPLPFSFISICSPTSQSIRERRVYSHVKVDEAFSREDCFSSYCTWQRLRLGWGWTWLKRGKPWEGPLTVENKLRVTGGEVGRRWARWVMGIKDRTCCDEHGVLYVSDKSLNSTFF